MDEFTISVAAGPAYTVVTLTGECDLNNGRWLRDVLTSEVSHGTRKMIVDLSSLSFMDSTGMQILLSSHTVLALHGGSMALVAPQPVVARVLELTGASEIIPVYASLDEARTAD